MAAPGLRLGMHHQPCIVEASDTPTRRRNRRLKANYLKQLSIDLYDTSVRIVSREPAEDTRTWSTWVRIKLRILLSISCFYHMPIYYNKLKLWVSCVVHKEKCGMGKTYQTFKRCAVAPIRCATPTSQVYRRSFFKSFQWNIEQDTTALNFIKISWLF